MSSLKLDVATPERVSVQLPLAGIGYRALAYLIDASLLFCVGIVLWFGLTLLIPRLFEELQALSGVMRAVGLVGLFLVLWGYWTGMEVAWHGQTIGKRVMKIRVVRADGSPVTPFDSAIRNLLRIVDWFPACYPTGVMVMLIDKQHRRLGDLVAGTVLVREEAFDLDRYAKAKDSARAWSAADLELVTGFLSRFEALEPPARLEVGRQLAAKLGLAADAAQGMGEDALKAWLEQQVGGP